MSKVIYQNYEYNPDNYYFLYIGELKCYGLNTFLQDALTKIKGKDVNFISIVPDVFEQYNYENIIVLNPLAEDFCHRSGRQITCRLSGKQFVQEVCSNTHVLKLIEDIISSQKELYIYMYESLPELTLTQIKGVQLLGPDPGLASKLNNKIYQYNILKNVVPLPEHHICQDLDEVQKIVPLISSKWQEGIFISQEYSAAGSNSAIVFSSFELKNKFKDKGGPFLVTKYIPHKYDPTVLAVVANENDVFIAGIADQNIEDGNKFTGRPVTELICNDVNLIKISSKLSHTISNKP